MENPHIQKSPKFVVNTSLMTKTITLILGNKNNMQRHHHHRHRKQRAKPQKKTHLSDAFKDPYGQQAREARALCDDWGQDGPEGRPRYADQQHQLAPELFGQHAARKLGDDVAVEEPGQEVALLLRIPIERTIHLCAHSTIMALYNNNNEYDND